MSPGQAIAHYRIHSKLGEGGMGEVWRATDAKLNRDVAIKVLPGEFAQDSDRMARFQREAQVLASLNHPNIAAIYGVEDRALVMELVDGSTLAERIAQGSVSPERALPIARQIAEALEYAHERNIVHRDLKPANIKVTSAGRVKVLDFGLAKAMAGETAPGDPASSPTLTMRSTQMGVLLGTAGYMSPEEARGKAVDQRTDIWAFGVVLYELLTGRKLFSGETVTDILASVVKDTPDLDQLPPDTPPRLRQLIGLCLRKDSAERLRHIGDAYLLLEEAETNTPPPANPAPKRFAALWAAGAAIVIAALAIALAWTARGPSETGPGAARFLVPLPPGTYWPGPANATEWVPSPDGR